MGRQQRRPAPAQRDAGQELAPRKMPPPEILHFAPSGGIPNNPHLPALLYRGALAAKAGPAAHEKLFARSGWPPRWRDGVYDFHHFHTTAHEGLGIAAGGARLLLGGPSGQVVTVAAGDVVLLPAGTGHRLLEATVGFLVVGAYPLGQSADLERGPATAAMIRSIATLPFPDGGPIGSDETYGRLWR
jgi:uncharacterized protein YjlB